MENTSFVKIIDTYIDEDENINQIPMMHHSSYYDIDNLESTLNNYKNKFRTFTTNLQRISSAFDELQV